MASGDKNTASYGVQEGNITCCCDVHNALAAIFDLLDAERRASEDREKRLLTRIGELSRTVADLTTNMEEMKKAVDKKCPVAAIAGTKKENSKNGKSKSKSSRADLSSSKSGPGATNANTVQPDQAEVEGRAPDAPRVRVGGTEDPGFGGSGASLEEVEATSLSPPRFKFKFKTFEDDDGDLSWNLVTKKKPTPPKKTLYVGNLPDDIDEDKLKEFIAIRASEVDETVVIHDCSIQKKDGTISARLIVNKSNFKLLTARGFWLRPSYCREWKYKTKDKPDNKADDRSMPGSETNSANSVEKEG